jgi:hypothetical protein
MSQNPKEIVRKGHDAVSRSYRGDEEDAACERYHAWLDDLIPLLPKGAPVLDLAAATVFQWPDGWSTKDSM